MGLPLSTCSSACAGCLQEQSIASVSASCNSPDAHPASLLQGALLRGGGAGAGHAAGGLEPVEEDDIAWDETLPCFHEVHAMPLLDPVLDKQVRAQPDPPCAALPDPPCAAQPDPPSAVLCLNTTAYALGVKVGSMCIKCFLPGSAGPSAHACSEALGLCSGALGLCSGSMECLRCIWLDPGLP